MRIRAGRVALSVLLACLAFGAQARPDPKAPASITILVSTSDVQVAADGGDTRTLHMELRAGNDAGALQLGQTSIPYDAVAQTLEVVEAYTLKPGGARLVVEASAIYDQAPQNQAISLVSGLRAKLIVFPQFAAGDTAVYTVKIATKHPNFTGQFIEVGLYSRNQVANDIRQTITAPKSLPLYVESHEVEFSKHEEGGAVVYSWHYSNPSATSEDTNGLTELERTPRFFASTFKDYAELGRAYAALAEPKKVVTPKIQELADEITAKTPDARAQAQKIYEWVSAHIRYVSIELGTGSFIPHDVNAIVANGYGDCKDHDLLLQTLLKAKGIEARSILINSGTIYTLPDIPTFVALDHVITYLPRFDLYLDSSVGNAAFGILPLQEYGKPIVTASAALSKAGKLPVMAPGVSKVLVKTAATLDTDGGVTGTVTTTASGPYAILLKMIGLQIQAAGPGSAAKLLAASGYDNASGTFTADPVTGFADDYTISAAFKWSGWGDNLAGKNSFYMPPGLRLLGRTGDGPMGPLNEDKERAAQPVICFNSEQQEDLSLSVPDGYHFNGMPKDLRVESPNLLFVARWSLSGNTLTVHREFTSRTEQPICTAAIRGRSAAALKQISDSYNTEIFLTKGDAAPNVEDANTQQARDAYERAVARFDSGQYDLAMADLDTSIKFRPDITAAYAMRASVKERLHQLPGAVADLNKAVELEPSNFLLLYHRGITHYNAGEYQLAIADLDRVIEKDPKNANAFLFRGGSKNKLGHKKEGARDIATAVQLDPKLK